MENPFMVLPEHFKSRKVADQLRPPQKQSLFSRPRKSCRLDFQVGFAFYYDKVPRKNRSRLREHIRRFKITVVVFETRFGVQFVDRLRPFRVQITRKQVSSTYPNCFSCVIWKIVSSAVLSWCVNVRLDIFWPIIDQQPTDPLTGTNVFTL